jgi:hypothetical protein
MPDETLPCAQPSGQDRLVKVVLNALTGGAVTTLTIAVTMQGSGVPINEFAIAAIMSGLLSAAKELHEHLNDNGGGSVLKATTIVG